MIEGKLHISTGKYFSLWTATWQPYFICYKVGVTDMFKDYFPEKGDVVGVGFTIKQAYENYMYNLKHGYKI